MDIVLLPSKRHRNEPHALGAFYIELERSVLELARGSIRYLPIATVTFEVISAGINSLSLAS